MHGVRIEGLGIYLPENIVTNHDIVEILQKQKNKLLAQGVELTEEQAEEFVTSDEWIQARTGIKTRRFVAPGQTTSDLAKEANEAAWDDAYGDGLEIPEFNVLSTVSPDFNTTPGTSVITHRKMGIPVAYSGNSQDLLRNFFAVDVTQACSSLMNGLLLGTTLIESGRFIRGLVSGVDVMTTTMSWNKRSPFVILGDAGASAVLARTSPEESWFGPNAFLSGVEGGPDGEYEDLIKNLAGGSAVPLEIKHLDPLVEAHLMFMNGREVYKKIVPRVSQKIIPTALKRAELDLSQIDVFIFHQANMRMTEGVLQRIVDDNPAIGIRLVTMDDMNGVLYKKKSVAQEDLSHIIVCYCNIDRYGNTTSASILLGAYEARELGLIEPGKRVMLAGFGGGFSWCTAIIEWGGRHLFTF